jgi:hypothetical protein
MKHQNVIALTNRVGKLVSEHEVKFTFNDYIDDDCRVDQYARVTVYKYEKESIIKVEKSGWVKSFYMQPEDDIIEMLLSMPTGNGVVKTMTRREFNSIFDVNKGFILF